MNFSQTEITFFNIAVTDIFKNNTVVVLKCVLRINKRNTMLIDIFLIFIFVLITVWAKRVVR